MAFKHPFYLRADIHDTTDKHPDYNRHLHRINIVPDCPVSHPSFMINSLFPVNSRECLITMQISLIIW